MKINAVRAMLIVSLAIILFYILGLFLPIIKNTKINASANKEKNIANRTEKLELNSIFLSTFIREKATIPVMKMMG